MNPFYVLAATVAVCAKASTSVKETTATDGESINTSVARGDELLMEKAKNAGLVVGKSQFTIEEMRAVVWLHIGVSLEEYLDRITADAGHLTTKSPEQEAFEARWSFLF